MTLQAYFEWYDRLYADKDYRAEAAFLMRQFEILTGRAPRKLLEVGCGTGNHTAAVCAHGVTVSALDLEPDAIAVARSKAIAGANFHAVSVSDLADKNYDGAYSLFNVVNYIPDTANLVEYLNGIRDRLLPGAPFIFDCWNGAAALIDPPKIKESRIHHDGIDITVTTVPNLDPMEQTAEMTTHFSGIDADGRAVQFTESYRHRLWTPRELREQLDLNGLAVERVCAWMTPDKPATIDDWKIMVIARKREN